MSKTQPLESQKGRRLGRWSRQGSARVTSYWGEALTSAEISYSNGDSSQALEARKDNTVPGRGAPGI